MAHDRLRYGWDEGGKVEAVGFGNNDAWRKGWVWDKMVRYGYGVYLRAWTAGQTIGATPK